MKKFRSLRVGLSLLLALGMLFTMSVNTQAVEVPPAGNPVYIQTNGIAADISDGDWYTSNANGSVPGYHYFKLNVPCGWPNTLPIYIDLFSPGLNIINNNPPTLWSDEWPAPPPPYAGPYTTTFEMYPAGTVVGPLPNQPAPGAGLPGSIVNYPPILVPTPENWVRYFTLAAPVTCGSYVLRSEARGQDENGWRLRFGGDDDNNPITPPPANYDNPDGLPGTNDELTIGLAQTTYQHDQNSPPNTCITLFQYVSPGQAQVAFHNFDLDDPNLAPQSVTYTSPGGTNYPGIPSGDTVWNNGTQTNRGTGDVIPNPQAGWWQIQTCSSYHNQFIQEGQFGVPAYYTQPPTPRMIVAKDDGLTVVTPNQVVSYTLSFTNTSNVAPPAPPVPGPAVNVVLTDTVPTEMTYVSCGFNAPYTGTCSQVSPGLVRFAFAPTSWVNAGASGSLRVTAQVNPNAVGPLTNTVTLTYQDPLGNPYPPVGGSDTDIIQPVTPTPTATATAPPAATSTPTSTPVVPPTDTPTNTPVVPPSNTPVPPPTNTPVPGATDTPVPPAPTNTSVPPPGATDTPVPPAPTNTSVPPPGATDTPTNVPAPPPPTGTPPPPPPNPPPVNPPPPAPTPTASSIPPPGMPRSGAGSAGLFGDVNLLLALLVALALVATGVTIRRRETRRLRR